MYKALITDLDGTAIAISSDGSDIDAATQNAVKLAIHAGKKLTCATGREWELTKGIIAKLGFVAPAIVEGGTRIVDPNTEETLWEKAMDDGTSIKVLDIFKATTSSGLVMHSSDISRRKLSETNTVPRSLRYLYLLAIDEQIGILISNAINATSFAVAHITPSWEGADLVDLHVTHPQATKEHAIQAWQTLEHVTKAETIGMGDSGNDVPIFLSSGYKVAVSNAADDLKGLADYIAPAATNHALEHIIRTTLLNANH